MLNKLVVVDGAVTDDDLGMEEKVTMELSESVDVIVNSAANTTFDERLIALSTVPSPLFKSKNPTLFLD